MVGTLTVITVQPKAVGYGYLAENGAYFLQRRVIKSAETRGWPRSR
jgi:hypothetical protein